MYLQDTVNVVLNSRQRDLIVVDVPDVHVVHVWVNQAVGLGALVVRDPIQPNNALHPAHSFQNLDFPLDFGVAD